MKLNLITFASVLAKQESSAIRDAHKELITALGKRFEVNILMHQEMHVLPIEGLNVIFIATGGTEGLVVEAYKRLPHPLILLTDGKANSLAASLELSTWMRNNGDNCKLLHGDFNLIISELETLYKVSLLKGKRIGVIGEPSDWLVASGVDYATAKERWGVEYVDIPLNKVEQYFAEVNEGEACDAAKKFEENAIGCVEPTKKDIEKAARLYVAVKKVAHEEKLDALTIQCFSLIGSTGTTGCLALALLNDEGIIAGCEGDLQTVFTMLLVKTITGKDGFMANPANIDTTNNEVVLAHCTIGLKQTTQYIIRNHFESLSGVAIQGYLPEEDVTIVKVGGEGLDKMCVLEGRICENQNDPRKCRTQIKIQLDAETSPASYFLQNSIGNHHVVIQGHHAAELKRSQQ